MLACAFNAIKHVVASELPPSGLLAALLSVFPSTGRPILTRVGAIWRFHGEIWKELQK